MIHRNPAVRSTSYVPELTRSCSNDLRQRHYTSGVIAWAPEDQPTDNQIEAVVDAFEKTAWAGLDFDRYAWTVVLHREEGGGAHSTSSLRFRPHFWRCRSTGLVSWVPSFDSSRFDGLHDPSARKLAEGVRPRQTYGSRLGT